MAGSISLNQLRTEADYNLISLYEDEDEDGMANDSPFQYTSKNGCHYYEQVQFSNLIDTMHSSISYFHLNCRGLSSNWESFRNLLFEFQNFKLSFDFIGMSEVYRCDNDQRLILPGYHNLITRCREDSSKGGVGIFVKDNQNFKIREDLSVFIPHVFESLFIEIISSSKSSIVGVIYRPNTAPKANVDIFSSTLQDIMDIINNEHKHGVIMGDMNVDLLKFGSHPKTDDYLDNIFSHGFLPVITKPTRVTSSSATLIDHIYTNNISSPADAGIIVTDVADHFGVFYLQQFKSTGTQKNTLRQIRYYSEANINKFKNYLQETDFSHILNIDCAENAYDQFMELYRMAFEKAFPLRSVKVHKKYIKKDPWITSGLLTSSRQKAKLFSKKLNNPSEHNINAFKIYNNIFNKLKRNMKRLYYKSKLDENKLDMKKTWSILKQAIGKQNDKASLPVSFSINGQTVTNKLEVAGGFNDYFSKIGEKTSHNVPTTKRNFTDYMPKPVPQSMFLEPVIPDTIIETTHKLKSKSSFGHDGISSKILKLSINIIAVPITHIINLSLTTGFIPGKLKIAKVIPIFKSADASQLKNYRPISLLPVFSKLLEKIMYDKLISFLNANNILYKHQYGFRSKHSTIHPIIHLLNHCAEASNKSNPEYTLATLCDLSKAFDVISHKILLQKLHNYGIRGIANKWFENYLSDRSQFVEFDNFKSSLRDIKCGVPQGSILGPLLYLIYVNDIGKSSNFDILSFADDTTLYMSHRDLNTLYINANTAINELYDWFCANKLALNANKTKYIVINPKRSGCNFTDLKIKIAGVSLERIGVSCKDYATKFLGIYIDESLTWKKHLSHVNSKISRAIFSINQVKHFLPYDSLRTLYFALIHPHLSYGILAWGNSSKSTMTKTIKLQKRAIRTIHKSGYNSHTDPLFQQSGILKLKDLYEYQTTLFMLDYINKRLPRSFNSTFIFNHQIQSTRTTRQSNLLHITRCKSNFACKLPLYTFPHIWNKWSSMIAINVSLAQIKRQMKNKLLDAYHSSVKCTNVYCTDCGSKQIL